MAKFLANALFKGSLTVDNGITLTGGKNITTTNQMYVLASNYANGIAVGYDTSAVYLGYSMGTVPIHLGTNGSGNLVVKTTGNTVIENGALVIGQAAPESGTKLTVNGAAHIKNGYLFGNATSGGDFGFYPETGYYELSAPAGPNQGVIFVLNGKHTGKQIGFYTGDTTYPGMLLYEQAPVGGDLAYWTKDKWAMTPNHNLVWAATSGGIAIAQGPYDIGLTREAAGVLQVNNGTVGTYANLKLAGLTASSLAGTGTRMVVANSSGQLSTQALPGGGTVSGTGTTNYVSKWISSTALGNSTIFDDGNGVGIGTATLNAQTRLTVMGSPSYSKSIVLDSTWNFQTSWAMRNGIHSTEFNLGGSTKTVAEGGPGSLQISTYNATTNTFRYPMTFFANANVSFGGTSSSVPTDNGSTLQVNGSASVSNLVGTGTRMVVASSTGILSTQAITATGLQSAVDTDKNSSASLAVGTTSVKLVSATTYTGVFFDYVVKKGTNVRVGSVVAITNGTNIEFYETFSNDIGSTIDLTFTVTLSSGNISLNAVAASTGFTVIVSTRAI